MLDSVFIKTIMKKQDWLHKLKGVTGADYFKGSGQCQWHGTFLDTQGHLIVKREKRLEKHQAGTNKV